MLLTDTLNPLESVNNPALVVANNNNSVLADGVIGDDGGIKSTVYNAVPLTKLKLVINPGKANAEVNCPPLFPIYTIDTADTRLWVPMLFPGFTKVPLTNILNVDPILDIAIWFQSDNVVYGTEVTKDTG